MIDARFCRQALQPDHQGPSGGVHSREEHCMTDPTGSNAGSNSSPAGFDMLEKMWSMMRLPSFPGMSAGAGPQGFSPSLGMMSDLISPLTNVEELDKRITDMRAVEQWLKLNLNMLQSAIQALEVQRATLATLKAFGAFAQTSMDSAAANLASSGVGPAASPAAAAAARPAAEPPPPDAEDTAGAASGTSAALDPAAWWNVLQSQFNQIAGLAMAAADAGQSANRPAGAAPGAKPSAAKPGASASKPARKTAARSKPPKTAGKP
jgi:hypothetical protein